MFDVFLFRFSVARRRSRLQYLQGTRLQYLIVPACTQYNILYGIFTKLFHSVNFFQGRHTATLKHLTYGHSRPLSYNMWFELALVLGSPPFSYNSCYECIVVREPLPILNASLYETPSDRLAVTMNPAKIWPNPSPEPSSARNPVNVWPDPSSEPVSARNLVNVWPMRYSAFFRAAAVAWVMMPLARRPERVQASFGVDSR